MRGNLWLKFCFPVIHQCGLTRDLSLFDAGDATEVGEKGLTLRFVIYIVRLFTHTHGA